MLGLGRKGAIARLLPHFFVKNRARVFEMMLTATGGATTHFATVVQSLQGRRRRVVVTISRGGNQSHDLLTWVLSSVDEGIS